MSSSFGDDQGGGGRATNPYAVKKAGPGLFTKPLEDLDEEFDEEVEVKKAAETRPNERANTSTDQTSNMDSQAKLSSLPMSVSLPLWKRLPSKSVTLGPAEILAITEVCHHASLYATKSVRTTGVLTHRFCHPGTSEVSLVLKDPLAKLLAESNIVATTTAKKSRRISFGSTPAAVEKSTTKRRPSLGMARNRTTPLVSRTRPSSTVVKTPLVSKGIIPRTPLPFQTPALSSRKRPAVQTPSKKTPKEAFVSALTQHDTSVLWIVADSRHVPIDTLSIGDIVTVMGTVEEALKENQIVGLIQKARANKPQSDQTIYHVQARILRQDNGANMRLHQEALLMRRKHLLTTHFQNQAFNPPTGGVLLGCGPPPYNKPA